MKIKSIIYVSSIVVLAIVCSGLLNQTPVINEVDQKLITTEVPDNLNKVIGSGSWASYIQDYTIDTMIKKSELVAIIEVKSHGTSYSMYPNHPFTIYSVNVIQVIKGNTTEKQINVLLREGYLKENTFIQGEGEPDFKIGDKWLLFLNEIEYEKDFEISLPGNTYRPEPPTSAKLENNFFTLPYKTLVPKMALDGLSFTEFNQQYTSP